MGDRRQLQLASEQQKPANKTFSRKLGESTTESGCFKKLLWKKVAIACRDNEACDKDTEEQSSPSTGFIKPQ